MARPLELTPDDQIALNSLRHKQSHVEDAVTSLALGHDTAIFVWGEGGTGKSYTCEAKLRSLRTAYILHNSRMTGRGLVDALAAAPTAIHWIEDAETLLDDKKAIGVLRSACWSQSKRVPKVRPITWTAHRVSIRFDFTGGLLIVSNANLTEQVPEIRALETRIKRLHVGVSASEVLALTKTICQHGYQFGIHNLTPTECWNIVEFVRHRLELLHRQLDLRLVLLSFGDYVLARESHTSQSWQELVEARMQGSPTQFQTPREKLREHRRLAAEIYAKEITQAEKVKEWREQTGKNRASFYNALKK